MARIHTERWWTWQGVRYCYKGRRHFEVGSSFPFECCVLDNILRGQKLFTSPYLTRCTATIPHQTDVTMNKKIYDYGRGLNLEHVAHVVELARAQHGVACENTQVVSMVHLFSPRIITTFNCQVLVLFSRISSNGSRPIFARLSLIELRVKNS